jgi:hypothetical protein
MGQIVIVAYAPKLDATQGLLELVRGHVPTLRHLGLATDRPAYVMRNRDGILLELFEWKSSEAQHAAHENSTVLELWDRFEALCEYRTLASLHECHAQFASFEPVMIT